MYPRRSRFSPEIRPGNARQQLGMTICACALTGSAVIMLGAFLLAGNFGVRQLVCSLIGSGAAVVFGICLLSLLPMLVRTMRAQLDQPGDAGPSIKTFFRIAMIALVATACTVMGGGAFGELSSDARQGPQTRAVTSCENFQTFTEHGRRGSTYYRNVFTLHFDNGKQRHFNITTHTQDEFTKPTSPYYAVYQACVVRPFTTSLVVDYYPRSGIIKAIREA